MINKIFSKLFAVNLALAPVWVRIFFYASVIVSLASVMVSVTDLVHYSGMDFLQRYVGARCGWLGLDPYKTSVSWWLNGISRELHELQFAGVPRPLGVICNPPSLLLVYMPLTLLDYTSARYVSGCLEWIAFFTAILVLARTIKCDFERILSVSSAMFFFSGAPFWRLHVERGQYYVFTVLLIALALFVLLNKKKDLLSGLILGIALSVRPTVLFLIIPFALQRRWNILAGTLCSGLVIGVLSLSVFGIEGWKNFKWISEKYELASTDFGENHFADCSKDGLSHPLQDFEVYKKEVGAPLPSINSTFAGLLRVTKLAFKDLSLPVPLLLLLAKFIGVGVSLLFILWFVSYRPPPLGSALCRDGYMFYAGIAAINLVEYTIPYRAAYADIYYLLPVMLGIPIVAQEKRTWLGVLLLAALSAEQNLLGHVHGWFAIPVRVVGLTLFSVGVLYYWHARNCKIPSDGAAGSIE